MIEALGPSADEVDLGSLFWAGTAWDAALHAGALRRLARSRRIPGGRELWHHAWPGGEALDYTRFELGDRFAEVERRYARDGPNAHATPLVLPRRLRRGERVPIAGGTVSVVHVGAFRLGGLDLHGACLEARGADHVVHQWLATGIGEVALGPAGGPPRWWMEGWRGDRAVGVPVPQLEAFAPLPLSSALRAAPPSGATW